MESFPLFAPTPWILLIFSISANFNFFRKNSVDGTSVISFVILVTQRDLLFTRRTFSLSAVMNGVEVVGPKKRKPSDGPAIMFVFIFSLIRNRCLIKDRSVATQNFCAAICVPRRRFSLRASSDVGVRWLISIGLRQIIRLRCEFT